jgi:hypothetical protein
MISLREWQLTQKSFKNLIVQASTVDGLDRMQPFPIGMQYSYCYNFRKGDCIQIGQHDKTVMCAINPKTDANRRPRGINRQFIINKLYKNGIINNLIDHTQYFESLPSYKFIVSPEGNGIDCHRHYEELIAGCIPIIEYNSQIEEKYKNCPILYTKDYSEISEEYLIEKYNEMIYTNFDFSRLFLSNYENDTQQYIKMCGNFWIKKNTNKLWYIN